MRRRIPYRVCSCTSEGIVTHLEARLLKDIVNSTIHPIRCAESCKRKYKKGMYIGDLCAETGHFWWALKVWWLTARLIEDKDFDDWRFVWFDNKRVRLTDVISETECELLQRRCSDLWRALGYPEYAWWTPEWDRIAAETFGTSYTYLFAEKYNSNWDPAGLQMEWDEEMRQYEREQATERIFQEALN